MLGINLALQATLAPPLAAFGATQPSAELSSATPGEATPSTSTDFDQLLQGLSEVVPSTESALPGLLAVASMVGSSVGSSNLAQGIEKPAGSAETPKGQQPADAQIQSDPLTALQALLGIAPFNATKGFKTAQPLPENQVSEGDGDDGQECLPGTNPSQPVARPSSTTGVTSSPRTDIEWLLQGLSPTVEKNPSLPTAQPTSTTGETSSPRTNIESLLHGLFPTVSPAKSALPELLAVVGALTRSSSRLEGIDKPTGPAETPKQTKTSGTPDSPESDLLAALQALLGNASLSALKGLKGAEPIPTTSAAPETPPIQEPPSLPTASVLPEAPAPATPAQPALPELFAAVASLVGIEKPIASVEIPKDKKSPDVPRVSESDPLMALQALLDTVPQISSQPGQPQTTAQPKTSQEQPSILSSAEEPQATKLETAKPDAPLKPLINLKDFDVRRYEFKTELEIATVQPKLIRVAAFPGFAQGQWKPNLTQPKPVKGSTDVIDSTAAASSVFGGKSETPLITAPEAVQRVQVAIDPPAPPPIVRQISIDIGDSQSEVRVVIRERNGELAVQVGAATERLRENLQNASPLLMHELRRDNPHTVSLDFSRFGSATESGRESHQESPRKKALKPEAVFADLDETAYPGDDEPSDNSF